MDARGSGGVDALREVFECEKCVYVKIKVEFSELELYYVSDLEICVMKMKKLWLKDAVAAFERDVRRVESFEVFGAGLYGKVWKVRDLKMGVEVVVKIELVDDSVNGVVSVFG